MALLGPGHPGGDALAREREAQELQAQEYAQESSAAEPAQSSSSAGPLEAGTRVTFFRFSHSKQFLTNDFDMWTLRHRFSAILLTYGGLAL